MGGKLESSLRSCPIWDLFTFETGVEINRGAGRSVRKWDRLQDVPFSAGGGGMSLAEVRLQECESIENALRRPAQGSVGRHH
jgi:hypothetical protein